MARKRGYDSNRVLFSLAGIGVMLAILILANVLLSFANVRYDATEEKIYSLSEGTKKILKGMKRPVTVKFFYSRSNPVFPRNLKVFAGKVRDFLAEYENESGSMINVEVYDPKMDSEEEEWAQKYGIKAIALPTGENIYCGIIFVSEESEHTIPILDPSKEALLEYDFTRIINDFQSFEKKRIGVLASIPVFGMQNYQMRGQPPSEAWFFISELKKTYDVKQIDMSAESIDPEVDLLLIIHPKSFGDKMQYKIDQYILGGGNALVFVDPFCVTESMNNPRMMMRPSASSLDKLFDSWGVSMETSKFVVDFDQPTRLRNDKNEVENNPAWISVRSDSFNDSDIVTSGLERMLMPVAGSLLKGKDSTSNFEVLIKSGEHAGLLDTLKANMSVEQMKKEAVIASNPFNLAVRIRGKFRTAFPDGPPGDKDENNGAQTGHLEIGEKESAVIIVSDVDMLVDGYYVSKANLLGFPVYDVFNDNLNLIANAAELLTGSEDLIGLRSRGSFERPFTVVLELERKAQQRWLDKEKELVRQEEETNRILNELQLKKDDSQKMIISPEQQAEIAKFREKKRRIDRELKEVRKKLREEIERLGFFLKAINIFLIPLIVSVGGIGFALYRQRRMKGR